MLADLRVGLRGLIKVPGFTLAAIATLALGMGATTVVFSLVDALIIRPQPFGARSDRLVTLHSTHPTQAQDWDDSEVSFADLGDFREQAQSLEDVEGYFTRTVALVGADESERVPAASVTIGLFGLLGVDAARGRTFREGEGADPGFEQVVVLSDAIWRRRFGADPSIVDRAVRINGRALTVVGIMPEGFRFPGLHDLWFPYVPARLPPRDQRGVMAVGLLRPDVGVGRVHAELSAIARNLGTRFPDTNRDWDVRVLPLRDFYVSASARRGVTAILAASFFVLFVGAINVAGLLLTRGMGRHRELMLRAALGAGRGRIARLLLAESVLLSAAGAAAGLLLASWGIDALIASMVETLPYWVHLGIDGRVLAFVFGTSVATSVVCGLLPALRVSRPDLQRALADGGRAAGGGPVAHRLQGALVVGQAALSLALLIGATLLVRSSVALWTADAGFNPAPLLSVRIYLAGDRYDPNAVKVQALEQIGAQVRALPGVVAASFTGSIPADDGGPTIRVVPEGAAATPGDDLGVQMIVTMPDLWDALALRLHEGRTFSETESRAAEADVVIINRRLAERLWPGGGAVGRTLTVREAEGLRALRVIGVAPNLVYEELGEETVQSQLNVYMAPGSAGRRTMALLVRTTGDPAAVAGAVRRVLHDVDPAIAPYDVLTMRARRAYTQWGERFLSRMFTGFAVAALLMACLGAYGVMAYSTAQHTREIGVRLALGATGRDVVWLFLRRGVLLTALGLALGAPLAFATARSLAALLYRVSPWSPSIWVGTPLVLGLALLAAGFLPAWRASRTDPALALRQD